MSAIQSRRVVSTSSSTKHRNNTGLSPSTSTTALRPSQSDNIVKSTQLVLNDDMAEKASRRKSAHFGDLGVQQLHNNTNDENMNINTSNGGVSGSNGGGGVGANERREGGHGNGKSQPSKRVVSALAVQAGKKKGRLSAVNPEMVGVSWEQRESNYEEWMKVAIDNVSLYHD